MWVFPQHRPERAYDELRGMGVNRAHVHTDLMIGSDEVDGLHAGGDAVPLLRGGNCNWRDHAGGSRADSPRDRKPWLWSGIDGCWRQRTSPHSA